MIELNIGCFHMTCRCRTEFCYLCRARWKTCPCRQWDEERLLAAAEQRVDAQLGADRERGVQPAARPPPDFLTTRNPFAILDEQPANPAQAEPPQWPALVPTIAIPRHAVRQPTVWSSNGRPAHIAPSPAMATRPSTNTATIASTSTSGQGYWTEFGLDMGSMRECMIREMMEILRVDHDCDHIQWRYQDGSGHCEGCGYYLPLYLFVSGVLREV